MIKDQGNRQRVACLVPGELTTTEKIVPRRHVEGYAPGVDINRDIVKMAVLERHLKTGHVGFGFLNGYGLKCGAVASSVAHDSHNLAVVGTNDSDMVLAANRVRENKGGLAVALDGKIIGELPLPVAGLMSFLPAAQVQAALDSLKQKLRSLGIPEGIDPFMTLAFASLPCIPKLRVNTHGMIDVDKQKQVPVFF